ncbi:helix-turn-helix domain-containing protein [Methylopila sp. Yamaguchi]|uniref:helix-turn-helix domain-containing protein n=1 Tax=Methylopila sp. Yamaguchi TaxID=1437817 RepID=UPI000CAC378B|nr:helix-turn-helix transcriptional regulator [Methylopila sp. Yamaguchi]GBD46854.1 hypothetical protein METY_0067 [Methylopila sp. Yamaguchi]
MAVENRHTKALRARLAYNIRRLRRRLGWSQDRLALEAGLNRTYLAEVESRSRNIGVDNVAKLAKALDVDPIEMFLPERSDVAPAPDAPPVQ